MNELNEQEQHKTDNKTAIYNWTNETKRKGKQNPFIVQDLNRIDNILKMGNADYSFDILYTGSFLWFFSK